MDYVFNLTNITLDNVGSKSMTAQDVIKSFCGSYDSFLINTIIILAVCFIVFETASYFIDKEHKYYDYLEKLYNNFTLASGVFFVYEAYYFITKNMSKSNTNIINILLAIFIIFLGVLVIRKVYKHYKNTDI